MIQVTKAGGGLLDEEDIKISVNSSNIDTLNTANEDDLGVTIIKLNSGELIHVNETIEKLHKLISSTAA